VGVIYASSGGCASIEKSEFNILRIPKYNNIPSKIVVHSEYVKRSWREKLKAARIQRQSECIRLDLNRIVLTLQPGELINEGRRCRCKGTCTIQCPYPEEGNGIDHPFPVPFNEGTSGK
jgi:hypothetical protein